MARCKSCGVFVDPALAYCPLCRRKFDVAANHSVNEWYPQYQTVIQNVELNKHKSNIIKPALFTAIVICCALTVINAFALTESIWCHIAIIPIAYVTFTITHTICSQFHLGLKILFQVVAISGLLFAVDVQSGFWRWSLNYVFPFLIIAATFFFGIIMTIRKNRLGEFLEFIIALILLSLLPMHLYLFRIANVLWPAILAEISSFLTIIGLITFSKTEFLSEIKRRFHF